MIMTLLAFFAGITCVLVFTVASLTLPKGTPTGYQWVLGGVAGFMLMSTRTSLTLPPGIDTWATVGLRLCLACGGLYVHGPRMRRMLAQWIADRKTAALIQMAHQEAPPYRPDRPAE